MIDHHNVADADVRDDCAADVVWGLEDESFQMERMTFIFAANAPNLKGFLRVRNWKLEGDANGVAADAAMGVFDVVLHGWLSLKD
jgi:hypothetical protein